MFVLGPEFIRFGLDGTTYFSGSMNYSINWMVRRCNHLDLNQLQAENCFGLGRRDDLSEDGEDNKCSCFECIETSGETNKVNWAKAISMTEKANGEQ